MWTLRPNVIRASRLYYIHLYWKRMYSQYTFVELRELVTMTRASDLTSCSALGLIALAFRERETIPPPRLLWLRVSLTRNQLLSRELVIGKN